MELAIAVGTTPTQISFWELGKFDPSAFHLIILADIFNVSLDELCCRDFKGGK
jgi:transcriptional regulator with XRE-family HTH domain